MWNYSDPWLWFMPQVLNWPWEEKLQKLHWATPKLKLLLAPNNVAPPWQHDCHSGTWVGWRCKPNRTKACITTVTKNLLGHHCKVQHVFLLETMENMEEEGNPIEANPEEELVGTLEKSLHAFFEMISPRSVWVTDTIYGWWVAS